MSLSESEQTATYASGTDDLRADQLGLAFIRAKNDAPVEWWYYNGHLQSGSDRYSFHTAFFRFNATGFSIGRVLPLRLLGTEIGFGHVSLTDYQQRRTHFSHRRVFGWQVDSGPNDVDLKLKDMSLVVEQDRHRLAANAADCTLNLEMVPSKPIARYGPDGLFGHLLPRRSHHVSYSRMSVSGSIEIEGATRNVDGTAWLDREYGEIGPDPTVAGWIWMSIQLDNDCELMIYHIHRRDQPSTCARAAIIFPDGKVRLIDEQHIQLRTLREFRSELSQAVYPVASQVTVTDPVDGVRWELTVDADFDSCEFDTRGTTSTFYWEGGASVTGSIGGVVVAGKAFMELVGFARQTRLGQFEHARKNLPLISCLANEIRLRVSDCTNQIHDHR
ncbi:lipocalin-like domain-containing protein [Stieleria varia]|uniref:Hydroxyneurosporene synthase (CrtC) n=1 Tax=Stieleria varia TaxID=2528005 RepID=A0A5C6A4U7_9BACT|nr:lipocalin-like domain-containing protein [Stieleria varia]TWT94499.1 Hydroxyneurosporene synthase (CrtC) [Stieleria varia]